MDIEEVNKKMNECVEKYDLEGYGDVFGGVIWFALSTQHKECNSLDDHFKNGTYNFTTPPYDGNNGREIYDIIDNHSQNLDSLIKKKQL